MHILLAQIYCELLPQIRDTAKDLGYAIAVHGSLTRDFDLVAFPWSDDACDKDMLVHAIMDTLHLSKVEKELSLQYEEKPHGRTAYAIQLGMGAYIDLSIFEAKNEPSK